MTSPEYQAPTWVNEDDPDFIEGVSPDLGAGYLNQLSGAVEDHGQRLGAITPVVTYLNANAISQDAGDNRYILQDNAVGFAPAEATANALAGKQPLDADLTALAGLDSATAGTVASDGAGWVKKTYAQLKTALGLVKGDVGLGNVDNTSDAAKPVSDATQAALAGKTDTATTSAISSTVAGHTTKLDTIATGATANATNAELRDRATHTGAQAVSTITGLQGELDAKAPLASPAFTGTPTGITKAHVGLGNVDNTSDADKLISSATQTALNAKANTSSLAALATSGKIADATDLDSTGAAVGQVVAVAQVSPLGFELAEPTPITNLDPIDALADNDELVVYDISTTETRKVSVAGVRTRPARAAATPDGAASLVGVPGIAFSSIGTRAMTANQIRYYPFQATAPIAIDQASFEVTTGPAAAGNTRLGLYVANGNLQPTGAPLFDHGIAVGLNAVGAFTQAISSLTLGPGNYVLATNVDQAMTFRAWLGGDSFVAPALGAASLAQILFRSSTYGAFPSTPVLWNTAAAAATPFMHVVMLRWSPVAA